MPLTSKGQKIMGNMKEQYGEEKGEEVFYASKNKGTISGVDTVRIGVTRKGHVRITTSKGAMQWLP